MKGKPPQKFFAKNKVRMSCQLIKTSNRWSLQSFKQKQQSGGWEAGGTTTGLQRKKKKMVVFEQINFLAFQPWELYLLLVYL